MTRDTRIAMLVGLLFIVVFGLVLSELGGREEARENPSARALPGERVYAFAPGPGREPVSVEVPSAGEDLRSAEPTRTEVALVAEPGSRAAGGPVQARIHFREESAPERRIRSEQIAPAPQQPPVRTHVVRSDENLIKIAKRYYGEENWLQYKRIVEANREKIRDEDCVPAGIELVIPPAEVEAAATAVARAPAATPAEDTRPQPRRARRPLPDGSDRVVVVSLSELPEALGRTGSDSAPQVYIVQRGDNLTKIAKQLLGDGSHQAVKKLYNANRDRLPSPDDIKAGMELRIPVEI